MTYGQRLQKAMNERGASLKRKISRMELSKVAECSPQNIGMIITNAKGLDQKLNTESHAKVCTFLKVNSTWLLSGSGPMKVEIGANDAWPFDQGIVSKESYMALPDAVKTIIQVRMRDAILEEESRLIKQDLPTKAIHAAG